MATADHRDAYTDGLTRCDEPAGADGICGPRLGGLEVGRRSVGTLAHPLEQSPPNQTLEPVVGHTCRCGVGPRDAAPAVRKQQQDDRRGGLGEAWRRVCRFVRQPRVALAPHLWITARGDPASRRRSAFRWRFRGPRRGGRARRRVGDASQRDVRERRTGNASRRKGRSERRKVEPGVTAVRRSARTLAGCRHERRYPSRASSPNVEHTGPR